MRWMSDGYRQTLARYIARGEERGPNTYGDVLFGIETLAEPLWSGWSGSAAPNRRPGWAELDIYLGEKDSWGHGYATEATRLMCRYGFEEMRLHSIHLWVVTENAAARRVYDKVGFIEEGRARQCFRRDGEWYDMYLMGLLASDPMQN